MKKVARYYLGEEGIDNFDADHIQVRRRLLDNTFTKKSATGNCGHVLRRMVLGDNGRMDKVKRVCRKKQKKNTKQRQCKVGHYKQLDNLPLPVQPQFRPWSARPRRGATSRAIWSD